MNEVGQVAGAYVVELDGAGQVRLVFVWDSGSGEVTVLNPDALVSPRPSVPSTRDVFIGDGGVVVAAGANAIIEPSARWWPEADGRYRREELRGGQPSAINGGGDVVGSVAWGVAAFWPADSSEPIVLPRLSDGRGEYVARDMNDAGVIG